MGFLGEGNTMTWDAVELVISYIKEHGILQVIEIMKEMEKDGVRPHLWGDEVRTAFFNWFQRMFSDDFCSWRCFLLLETFTF